MLASLFAIAAVVAVFGVAGTASASKVSCAGAVNPSAKEPDSKTAVQYTFLCDQNVLAYSITFNKQISVFEPEVLPLLPSGEASGELASCEGPFPGAGIGCTAQSSSCPSASSSSTACTGKIATGNTVQSEVDLMKPVCPQTRRQRVLEGFLTVTTQEVTAAGKTFVISSQPFHLDHGLDCPKPQKARS
jgi:hypothetical protein